MSASVHLLIQKQMAHVVSDKSCVHTSFIRFTAIGLDLDLHLLSPDTITDYGGHGLFR